ncbi:hypothetical protein A3C23_05685 [Candidatus Roizmanbacteria bacterium RIFCSPHIGHO2_02_FULL_37_13b]|uniref:Lycopene cyclase domain-containing protein n=1 Tax=Candidatus Roizmanbacteria bacterium RIFCSPLOWO2_02_FULL_36_11 TaxID=1802071 RepID=A0A1F7JCD8_9BACT|nr:MAG: hypothetical protein A3C23_05685 [Candidatus Roizmanbacteria bacterium RIFCSPHIGHO2_02_FULL_37_13b]OGK53269.1 MAG: hypothetical protein A3H78_03105 [Candidatus Roizmanbacteria bacterium RIFCSPLOWO2_02_FULL_36_11]
MLNYQNAYLIGTLVAFFPIWLIFFLWRKDLRREIIVTGIFGAILAPVSEILSFRDYWRPPIMLQLPFNTGGIEDILFGFIIAGIAATFYEICLGKHFSRVRNRIHHWILITVISFFILLPSMVIINLGFNINSVYALIVILASWSLIVLFYRHDLLRDALLSAIFFGIFYFLAFLIILEMYPQAVSRFWLLENLSGILLLGIPIEELLFAFFTGLAVGPFYEFMCGLRIKDYS